MSSVIMIYLVMFSVSSPYNITGRGMGMDMDNIGEMIIVYWEGRMTSYNYLCEWVHAHTRICEQVLSMET